MAGETRQQRRERERNQRDQKKKLDDAAANIPQHLKGRIGKVSKLSESMEAGISRYGWRGNRFAEDGQEIRSHALGYDGRKAMKDQTDKRCLEIRSRHPDTWGKRGYAEQISHIEGLSVETIRRYFKRCPI
jgi:hypothetical protein